MGGQAWAQTHGVQACLVTCVPAWLWAVGRAVGRAGGRCRAVMQNMLCGRCTADRGAPQLGMTPLCRLCSRRQGVEGSLWRYTQRIIVLWARLQQTTDGSGGAVAAHRPGIAASRGASQTTPLPRVKGRALGSKEARRKKDAAPAPPLRSPLRWRPASRCGAPGQRAQRPESRRTLARRPAQQLGTAQVNNVANRVPENPSRRACECMGAGDQSQACRPPMHAQTMQFALHKLYRSLHVTPTCTSGLSQALDVGEYLWTWGGNGMMAMT